MSITAVPSAILPNPVEPAGAATATGALAEGGSADALAILPTATPQTPQAQAVSIATTSAAIRQSALGPLLADLAQAATLPDLPVPVQTAIAQVLAAQTPINPPPSAADLQAATTASGLFLEAQLASGAPPSAGDLKAALLVTQQVLKTWLDSVAAAAVTQTAGAAPTAPQGAPALNPPTQAATAATTAAQTAPNPTPTPTPASSPIAAPTQTSAGTSTAPSPATPAAPTPVANAPLETSPAQTSTPAAPATAATPATTTTQPAQTPNALPTGSLAVAPPAEASPAAIPFADTPTATLAAPSPPIPAQASATTATPAQATPPSPAPAPAVASPPPALPASAQASVNLYAQALARVPLGDLFGDAPLSDTEAPTAAATTQQALSATPRTAPAPPYAGGPTSGQKPTSPGLSTDAEPAAIARRLLTETGGAIARQELHQVASLPSAEASQRPAEAAASRWMFELPFATPEGSAVAQFEISRDGGGGAAAAGEATWRARFTLDLEPLGPVHAQVAVAGARAGVTLWAERPAAAAALRAQQAVLSAGLEDAAFAANVSVQSGAPPRQAPPSGRFLDQAS